MHTQARTHIHTEPLTLTMTLNSNAAARHATRTTERTDGLHTSRLAARLRGRSLSPGTSRQRSERWCDNRTAVRLSEGERTEPRYNGAVWNHSGTVNPAETPAPRCPAGWLSVVPRVSWLCVTERRCAPVLISPAVHTGCLTLQVTHNSALQLNASHVPLMKLCTFTSTP